MGIILASISINSVEIEILEILEILKSGGRWGEMWGDGGEMGEDGGEIQAFFDMSHGGFSALPACRLPPELQANRSRSTLNLFLFDKPHRPVRLAGQPSPPFFFKEDALD